MTNIPNHRKWKKNETLILRVKELLQKSKINME
jgi:hypothetical protein